MSKQMKILFLGDYSNVHACLAGELRRMGHEVTVVSDGGGFQRTSADRLLTRRGGLFGGARYLYDVMSLLPELAGYDVVQLINPHFLSLKPGKIAYFFHKIKEANGAVYLTLGGNDHEFVKACVRGELFRYSEFRIGKQFAPLSIHNREREYGWLQNDVAALSEIIYGEIAGAMALLPEYYMVGKPLLGDKCVFTNIPIDLREHPFTEMPSFDDGVKMMVGMKAGMEVQKGTDILLRAAKEIEEELGGRLKVEKVSGLTYRDYLRRIQESHIVLDQLYAYSPATNALDTMALGRVAASGAEPEYYEMIEESNLRPIIGLNPLDTDLKGTLRRFVESPELLVKMGKQGRELVEKNNEASLVAKRFLNVWER